MLIVVLSAAMWLFFCLSASRSAYNAIGMPLIVDNECEPDDSSNHFVALAAGDSDDPGGEFLLQNTLHGHCTL